MCNVKKRSLLSFYFENERLVVASASSPDLSTSYYKPSHYLVSFEWISSAAHSIHAIYCRTVFFLPVFKSVPHKHISFPRISKSTLLNYEQILLTLQILKYAKTVLVAGLVMLKGEPFAFLYALLLPLTIYSSGYQMYFPIGHQARRVMFLVLKDEIRGTVLDAIML